MAIATMACLCAAAGSARAQTADEIKQANNPLAEVKALNIQNSYVSKLTGIPDETANTLYLRAAAPFGRFLVRATLPLATVPTGGDPESGLGDFNAFATFLAISEPHLTVGFGPEFVIPTASADALGSGKWQAGVAAIVFASPSAALQLGGLITWQASFAGDEDRESVSLLAVQPFVLWQLGGGWYLRSTAIAPFNLRSGDYAVPLGIGAGKVTKAGRTIFNLFLEPQFTFLHDGAGQPAFQVFGGINLQFGPRSPHPDTTQ